MIGELCSKYKSGAICTRIRVIHNDSYITAGTGFEAVYSVPYYSDADGL